MNIVVADDENFILQHMLRLVKQAGYEKVEAFQDENRLLRYIDTNKIDVAFLDVYFPMMSGIEIAEHIHKKYPKCNIIFVTAYGEFVYDAINIHASGYIHKPVTLEKIKKAMGNLLYNSEDSHKIVNVEAFGVMSVYIRGKQVKFNRRKSKEVFAYLLNAKGKPVTRKQIAAVLMNDADYTAKTQNYISQIIRDLRQTLREYNAESVFCSSLGCYSLDVSQIDCNAWNCVRERLTSGKYLEEYAWAGF